MNPNIYWLIVLLLVPAVLSSQAVSCDWSGDWALDWGKWDGKEHKDDKMTLTQTGDRVTGSYTWHEGKIDGKITGDKLKGKWTEKDNNGQFEFTMISDCKSFEGVWGYLNGIGDGYWNGKR